MKLRLYLSFLTAIFLLQACGGGSLSSNGDDNPPAPPEPPSTESFSVDIGPDLNVNEQSTINLSATVTGTHGALVYSWTIAPALGDSIAHADTALADATLTTPTATTVQEYTLRLTANDNGTQVFDELILTVLPVNIPPVANAKAEPFALDIYQDDEYPGGVTLSLDASDSTDPDSQEPVTFSWSQISGTDTSKSFLTPSEAKTTVELPNLDQSETLTYRVTVTDNEGASTTKDVSLTVLADQFIIPSVDAGADRVIFAGERFVLNAVPASTARAPEPYEFSWESANDSALAVLPEVTDKADVTALAPEITSDTILSFQVTATDKNNNSSTDNVKVTVKPFRSTKISDTGVDVWTTNSSVISSPDPDYPGQDADYGRDAVNKNIGLDKQGTGDKAFDFTKINDIGEDLAAGANTWSCVRDNHTGLIWETKTTGTGLRSISHRYSWFNTGSNNGGMEGSDSNGVAVCSLASCNTEAYVAAVNAAGLCGAFDWRLPTIEELYSILDFGKVSTPYLDRLYFPNTNTGLGSNSVWYWAVESAADGVAEGSARNAWALDVVTGNDNMLPKSELHRIRLVRAGKN